MQGERYATRKQNLDGDGDDNDDDDDDDDDDNDDDNDDDDNNGKFIGVTFARSVSTNILDWSCFYPS